MEVHISVYKVYFSTTEVVTAYLYYLLYYTVGYSFTTAILHALKLRI